MAASPHRLLHGPAWYLQEAIGHRQSELGYCRHHLNTRPFETKSLINIANAAMMLSELKLLVGELGEAEQDAGLAVEFADHSGDWGQKMRSCCRLAAVKHMQGDFDRAKQLFEEAVVLQNYGEPTKPVLYSDHGFLYRRFVLDHPRPGDFDIFLHEAEASLSIDRDFKPPHVWLVTIGLDLLSKASALAKLGIHIEEKERAANRLFEDAFTALKNSGSVIYLPEFHLAKARFQLERRQPFYGDALQEADNALRYAEDYKMPLYFVDANIIKVRAYRANSEPCKAAECMKLAETEMNQSGYFRWRNEIEQLR